MTKFVVDWDFHTSRDHIDTQQREVEVTHQAIVDNFSGDPNVLGGHLKTQKGYCYPLHYKFNQEETMVVTASLAGDILITKKGCDQV